MQGGSSKPPFLRGEYDCRVCDYREVEILPDSIVYADPPYIGTREYKYDTFDHAAFYDWCEAQEQPTFISEYEMPQDRFFEVAQWERTSTFSATNNGLKKIEKLFMPMKFKDWWDNQNKEPKQLELF